MAKRDAHVYRANGLSFAWEGGPYIDVYAPGQTTAFEAINVWDYEKGQAQIQGATRAIRHARFVGVVEAWLRDTWAEEGANYRCNTPGFPEFGRW